VCARACGSGAEQRESEQLDESEQVEEIDAESGELPLHGAEAIPTRL